jgi:hypothetical protein
MRQKKKCGIFLFFISVFFFEKSKEIEAAESIGKNI